MRHQRVRQRVLFITICCLLVVRWSNAYAIPGEDQDFDDDGLDEIERREDDGDTSEYERRQDGSFDFLSYFLNNGNQQQQQPVATSVGNSNTLGRQQQQQQAVQSYQQTNQQYQQQRTQQYQQQQPVQQYQQQQPVQQYQQQQQPAQQYQTSTITSGRTDTGQTSVGQQQHATAANRNGPFGGFGGGLGGGGSGGIIQLGGGHRPLLGGFGNFITSLPKIINILSTGGKVMMGVELGKDFYFGPVGAKPLYK